MIWYVNSKLNSGTSDGRSLQTAFASLQQALDYAKAGRYFHLDKKKLPDFVHAYVERDGAVWSVRPEVRRRVQFQHSNLHDAEYPDAGSWHLVLCANVLIYFGAQTVTHVLERFYRVPGTPGTGSGLGLAIVREIAGGHGARIELADGAGARGCRVALTFPHG